jgi:hypothetical protein
MTLQKAVLLFLSILPVVVLHAQEDSAAGDETSILSFFKRSEKTTIPDKVFLVTKTGKTVTLANFLKSLEIADNFTSPSPVDYGLADFDNNGKKELVVFGFTGGAHCCDEIYLFKNIGSNKFRYVTKTFAGNVYIDEDNNIMYDFYEEFGYFFTCYACEYEDSSVTQTNPIHNIELRYSGGKLVVEDGGPEMLRAIRNKLAKLSSKPFQKLNSEIDQDDGLRREFALTLAVYYYSFGKRNLTSTKFLFENYYKFPDAKNVWTAFAKQLQYVQEDNDF